MFTSQTLLPRFRALHRLAPAFASLALLASFASAQRVAVSARALTAATTASDVGPLPTSQPLSVTLRLAPTPEQTAALDQLLAAQTSSTSPSYHRWLTPEQYAASFGATDPQLATLTTWAQSQGLAVTAISAARTRLTLSGTVDQVQRAFATSLHAYVLPSSTAAQPRFAAIITPSVPLAIAPMIASVSGLDNLLPTLIANLFVTSSTARSDLISTPNVDPLISAATAIDANTASILTFNATSCASSLSSDDLAAYQALFRQANAQGITIVASNSCYAPGTQPQSQPQSQSQNQLTSNPLLSLPEVTSLVLVPAVTADSSTESRPHWQVAPGLPSDALRHQPDLTTNSTADFTQALAAIQRDTGSRLGNINATLYTLAATPGVYAQRHIASDIPDTWEPATGLGLVDLATLVKVFPRVGPLATTTSLTANAYGVNYGDALTFTSKVLAPVYGTAQPSGSVTFSAGGQTIGSATIDGTGTAVLKLTTPLNVGTYNIVATYSGDANYAASVSAPPIIVTVSIVNATITATVSPSANAPYGSTATVTATVALPGATGTPNGAVTAVVQSVTGSTASATLTPNPGGNTATANIPIAIPPPGSYTIEVSCTGNTNFQCQSPALINSFKTVKGNTLVNIATTPTAPQAGQPVTITALVSAAGNGPGPYNFTGTMTFYDNGKLLATGAVSTNQTATSVTLSGNITHNISASYSGDTNWNPSASAPSAVTPTLLPATLTLSSNLSTALYGTNVVVTATVFTTISNTVGPTGTISFYDTYNNSIVQMGSLALTPNGPNQSIARFTTTGLLDGDHSIYAIYTGDSNFTSTTSATLPIGITDFNIVMNPQTLTLKAGQTGKVVVLVGSVGGFNGIVSFGCTPPAGAQATCSFSQPTLQGGGATTLTITTTAAKAKPASSVANGHSDRPWTLLGTCPALAMLLCLLLPRRRRALPWLLSSLLAVSLLPSLGCQLGDTTTTGNPIPADPGSPLGTQAFTITTAGTDGVNTARHNYQYQVTIQ